MENETFADITAEIIDERFAEKFEKLSEKQKIEMV